MFTEAIESILADQCTPAAIRAIENGGPATTLWSALADAGFLELMAAESAGGAALDLEAVFPICVSFGRHALPVPAAQSIAARVLLRDAPVPAGMITLAAHCRREPDGAVSAANVAFGRNADFVLGNLDGRLLLLDAARAERSPTGVRGSLCATMRWHRDEVAAPMGEHGDQLRAFSAALHAAAIAGAMERLFTMTLGYCNDRAQFGKPIGKFQAVQHQLSVMAEHVACAGVAAELAFPAGAKLPRLLAAATAKSRTSASVPLVAATAHALHGAIGVTEEYDLQLYSRRLHEWRMADGSEAWWNRIVGEAMLGASGRSVLQFVREEIL
ncbi:acyl-CoA dehydrogenase family protein [Variovorax saccharolyticus]|uniref:acyl-CoA dehydrogenase family protein n=1 Tax=Variovorax saccharolyticus TaxID=3053516 RepID=UPI002578F592|nr:acyl-CoA dehydrogenase family protein [Variovorax sp. J31P216]MDM0025538.1 acyl-CoA dehydrogenase family protein [Variovorax sp. J31P216]